MQTPNADTVSLDTSEVRPGFSLASWRFASLSVFALLTWALLTWLFWIGYAGSDDFAYVRFANSFDRAPANWWEFRIPYIVAVRASFSLLGPSEFSAAAPTLLASLTIIVCVAWFYGWQSGGWKMWVSVLLAMTMPIDIGFRSLPGAPYFAAGLLVAGTTCMLKGGLTTQCIGAAILAAAFITHEVSFFYIAILCLAACAIDHRRYLWPVVVCVLLSALAFLIECIVYGYVFNDAFARYKTAAATTHDVPAGYDPDTGIGGVAFYLWPVRNLLFCKHFGFDLILLFTTGVASWRRLTKEQRVLIATTFLVWLWLGYGSQVPWSYKPLYRQFHYYSALTFGISLLLPTTVCLTPWLGTFRNALLAKIVLGLCLATHLVCAASSGRWGMQVDASRELLKYASANSEREYITDDRTYREMVVLNGFKHPRNVSPFGRQRSDGGRRSESSRVVVDVANVSGILINSEALASKVEDRQFKEFVELIRGAERLRVAPVTLRPILRPFQALLPSWEYSDKWIQSLGAEAIEFESRQANK